jgi:hypothetical protein
MTGDSDHGSTIINHQPTMDDSLFYSVAFGDPGGVAGEVRIDVSIPQIPGSDRRLFARFSGRTSTVEDEMDAFVAGKNPTQGIESVRRDIDSPRNSPLFEFILRSRIHEDHLGFSVGQRLQLFRSKVAYTLPL